MLQLLVNRREGNKMKPKFTEISAMLAVMTFIILISAVSGVQAQTGVICGAPGSCQPMFKSKQWDYLLAPGDKANSNPAKLLNRMSFTPSF